jgi:hypothetical protein
MLAGATDWRVEELLRVGDRVALACSWRAGDGSRPGWAQVLTVANGRIVGMHDYASAAQALRAVDRGRW